MVLYEDHAHDF